MQHRISPENAVAGPASDLAQDPFTHQRVDISCCRLSTHLQPIGHLPHSHQGAGEQQIDDL